MPEKFKNNINKTEVSNNEQSILNEAKEMTKSEKIRVYINYISKLIGNESKENKISKILEIVEKDDIFTKEDFEELKQILKIEERIIKNGKISENDEREIENIAKNENKASKWIKRILLFSAILLAPLYNKNKEETKKEKEQKIETKVIQDTNKLEKTTTLDKKFEKIPNDLEKAVEFFKNLDFIKENFYLLDKSNKKAPILYNITKEGQIISKDTVMIGEKAGDETKGYTTPAGIYLLSDLVTEEDKELYGKDRVLRLLGYSINGEVVDDIGLHGMFPLEKEERMKKMKNPESSKEGSHRCINVKDEEYKPIMENFRENGRKDGLIIAIMQEKNDFSKEKWENIIKKQRSDVENLKKIWGTAKK